MKIVIHTKPNSNEEHVRLFKYSIKFKRFPNWWYHYDCEYFVVRNRFHKKEYLILDYIIERLYEATHDVPNCEDCELIEAPVNYRQMEMEDRD